MSMNPDPVNPLDPAGLGVGGPPSATTDKGQQPFLRPVTDVSSTMLQKEQQAFIPQYEKVTTGSADRPRTKSTISGYLYAGTNLVDGSGRIVRERYDATREAYTELRSMDATERSSFLNEMYQRGLYDSKVKPSSTGLTPSDLKVMQQVLLASNTYGYTWRTALNFLRQENPVSSPGAGRKIPSAIDLGRALDEQALGSLGRTLTPQERQQQVANIQGQIRGGTDVQTSTLIEMAPGKVAPAEEQAYNFARVADITARILGGS
jgi:hypothetical protein